MKILRISIWVLLIIICVFACKNHEEKPNTEIHKETKEILASLDDKIYINIYMNEQLSPQFHKLQSSTVSLLESFRSYSNKEIDFDFVRINYLDSNIKDQGIYNPFANLDVHPIWVKNTEQYFKTYPYAIVHFKEKSLPVLLHNSIYYDTILELSDQELQSSIDRLEYTFMETIYLLQQEEKKKIAFIQGNGELDSVNTWDIRHTLSKFYEIEYFDLRSFELNAVTQLPDIDRQIERINKYVSIIIAKPTKPFLNIDKYILDQYIMNGGKILWCLDGTNANMNNFGNKAEFYLEKDSLLLDEYLSHYGAKINHDLIQDEECTKSPISYDNQIVYVDWPYNPKLFMNRSHIISNSQDSILTNFVSSIEILNPEKTTILLSSSKKSNILSTKEKVSLDILKKPRRIFEEEKIVGILIEDEFTSVFSDISPSSKLNPKLKSKNNKMIIIADGDIIANLHRSPNFYYPLGYYHYGRTVFDGNTNFILNAIQFLSGDDPLIKIKYKK